MFDYNDLKNPHHSNDWMYNLHLLCLEMERQYKEGRDTQTLFDVISDIAEMLLLNKDNLEESDYKAIVEITKEYELDIPDGLIEGYYDEIED